MLCIYRNDSIDILPLSKRAVNCAHRSGVHTVGDFVDKTEEDWNKTKNLGKITLNEILLLTKSITEGTGEFILSGVQRNTYEQTKEYAYNTIYIDQGGKIIHDINVNDLAISRRAINSLKQEGYNFASQLIGLNKENIAKIRNIGIKTVAEIIEMISKLTIEIEPQNSEISTDTAEIYKTTSALNNIPEEFSETYGANINFCIKELIAVRTDYADCNGETLIYRFYERPAIHEIVLSKILKCMDEHGKMSITSLKQMMPAHLLNTTVLEECLIQLENSGKIVIDEAEAVRVYPSIMKFTHMVQNDCHREMLIARLSGKTLDEIGAKNEITRERVRQIVSKEFRFLRKSCNTAKFSEDQYLPIFDKYQFNEKNFTEAFGVPVSIYYYLEMVDDKKLEDKLPIENILTDNTISVELRKKAETIIYKNYILDDGIHVKADRRSIVKHYVKQYCKEPTDYDKFQSEYNEWIQQFELNNVENCLLNSHTYKNYLATSEYTLWNRKGRFRYYNISEKDYSDLLETIDLSQYKDIVLSSAKWVRDYPQIMAQYDIRDEFELHNLLKKLGIAERYSIHFGKMPTVKFGNGCVANQIFDLLVDCAPITADDLARNYEYIYGVRADVLRGSSDIKAIDPYFENGCYRIDYPSMSFEQIDRMTYILNDDFYTIEEVRDIFHHQFPDADMKIVNTYSLKTLGFQVFLGNKGYLIRNTYQSAAKYFHNLLTKDAIFDMRNIKRSIKDLVTFSSELYGLRSNYEIVEFLPMQYISSARLNEVGVTRELLENYCKSVADYTQLDEYFTIKSLRRNGFYNELDGFGFEEWFYSSILAENDTYFSYTRIGGTRLFIRDRKKKQYGCSFEGLICNILESFKRIGIYELSDYLNETFGINLPMEKIKEAVNESDLYYNSIMESVYIDYDTYFEEI